MPGTSGLIAARQSAPPVSPSSRPSTSGRWDRLRSGLSEAGKHAMGLQVCPYLDLADGPSQRRSHRLSGPPPTPNAPYRPFLPYEVRPWGGKTAFEFRSADAPRRAGQARQPGLRIAGRCALHAAGRRQRRPCERPARQHAGSGAGRRAPPLRQDHARRVERGGCRGAAGRGAGVAGPGFMVWRLARGVPLNRMTGFGYCRAPSPRSRSPAVAAPVAPAAPACTP